MFKNNISLKKILFVLCFLLTTFVTKATHILAGDILVSKVTTNDPKAMVYDVKMNIYYDLTRVNDLGGVSAVTQDVAISFGDGSGFIAATNYTTTSLPNNVLLISYNYKNHPFPSFGKYKISYTEYNRIDGIINMSNSVNTPLYLESYVVIDPFLLSDELPKLLNPPIDMAYTGQVYKTTPGAFDLDGDSVTFELVPPKKGVDTDVDGYMSPADPSFGGKATNGGSPTIKIDPETGIVTWDTPAKVGVYNIAILIKEYRNGTLIGYVIRDMQITVKPGNNKPPILTIPPDACITAGFTYQGNVSAIDPDNHQISLSLVGYDFLTDATLSPTNRQNSPATAIFTYKSVCDDIQNRAHYFTFKAQDYPPLNVSTSDYKALRIYVYGPAPENFEVKYENKAAKLKWKRYNLTCGFKKQSEFNARISIYRTVCDSMILKKDCPLVAKVGELIAEVEASDTTFIDNNILAFQKYYYTIQYNTGFSQYGKSYYAPVKSIVSDLEVATLAGLESKGNAEIIKFSKPKTPILGIVKTYLYVASNEKNASFIKTDSIITNGSVDSSFTVKNRDFRKSYLFKFVMVNDKNEKFESNIFSTLGLSAKASNNTVHLSWSKPLNVSISGYTIYNAKTNAEVAKIVNNDSIVKYDITNLKNCDTLCYYVKANVNVCSVLGLNPFLMTSNIICETPREGSSPAVKLSILPSICDNYSCSSPFPSAPYTNNIHWKVPPVNGCDVPTGYNVYYQESDIDSLTLLGFTTDTFWIHTNMPSFAGCYLVKTLSSLGVEGNVSNTVCQDLCPCFELPNIITPNGDSLNEMLIPLPIPRFVESVHFKVYNRWGGKVYDGGISKDIYIRWNPGNLSDGVYFYEADVVYAKRAKAADRQRTIKGWVQIAR